MTQVSQADKRKRRANRVLDFDLTDPLLPLWNSLGTGAVAIVAGFLSFLAGRGMKTHEWRLLLIKEKVAMRQRLYADFLAEADKLVLESMHLKSSEPVAFVGLIRKFSEIELIAVESVSTSAKRVCDYAISSHTAGRKSDSEVDGEEGFYELKSQFISAVNRAGFAGGRLV
ncbi:hypothetical protein G6M12_24780 [Agrobacterium tumefaciens]|nr:hypothetical protein [Agrobacterium tumefaciens]